MFALRASDVCPAGTFRWILLPENLSICRRPCARGAVEAKLRLRGCFHIGQRQFMSKYNLLLYDNASVFCCAKSTSPCTGEAKSWTRLKMPVILSACEGSLNESMLHRAEILRRFPLRCASLQRQIARFPRVPALLRMTAGARIDVLFVPCYNQNRI